jgi:uncharacterized protein YjbI with pentapeptide repeats
MAKKDYSTRGWLDAIYLKSDSIQAAPELIRAFTGVAVVAALLLFVACVIASYILLVRLGSDALFSSSPAYQETAKNFVLTFASAFGAPFLVWRAWIAHRQANAASEQARVALENHITGIFSKSIELLGLVRENQTTDASNTTIKRSMPNIEARLGALYSLERLLLESEKDQRSILETLCAYVRENSPLEIPDDKTAASAFRRNELAPTIPRRADVQAALTIIGRRPESVQLRAKQDGWRLDLRNTNLIAYDLSELNYDRARFDNSLLNTANMIGSSFDYCLFERTFMRGAKMKGARFRSTNFADCDLTRAEIEATDFGCATFVDTDLREANVVSFNIKGANLENAFGHFLQYVIENLKTDGPNSVNSAEIVKTFQLFQKASHDDATNISQAARDAIVIMTQASKHRAERNSAAA